jgi:hypothetical protein
MNYYRAGRAGGSMRGARSDDVFVRSDWNKSRLGGLRKFSFRASAGDLAALPNPAFVMRGLDPRIHAFFPTAAKTWMARSSPAMTIWDCSIVSKSAGSRGRQ